VLAPNAKLRREIVPSPPEQATAPACDQAQGAPTRLSWARLLKRVFDIDIEHCPNCGGSFVGLRIRKVLAEPRHDLRVDIRRRGNAKVRISRKLWNHGEGRPAEADDPNT
jgi:hypothetical protein